jgi:hypothetical protein
LLQNGTFFSIEDARTEIFEYIEIYYNHIRRHSALGYQSPTSSKKNTINILFHLQVTCLTKSDHLSQPERDWHTYLLKAHSALYFFTKSSIF